MTPEVYNRTKFVTAKRKTVGVANCCWNKKMDDQRCNEVIGQNEREEETRLMVRATPTLRAPSV